MSPAAAVLWAAGLALECAGAVVAFRRKLWPLFALLFCSASTSFIGAFVFYFIGKDAYALGFWLQYGLQYILMASLACSIVAQMLRENESGIMTTVTMICCLMMAMAVGMFVSHEPTLARKLLAAELVCDVYLLLVLWVGSIGRSAELKHPWNAIAAGLLVRLFTDIACTALWVSGWRPAQRLYEYGEIVALLIWWIGPQWKELRRPRALAVAAAADDFADWELADS